MRQHAALLIKHDVVDMLRQRVITRLEFAQHANNPRWTKPLRGVDSKPVNL